MEEKNEVLVIEPSEGEGKCGFRMDAKSGLIGAGIVLAGIGLFKAGKVIKRKFRKVEEENTELDDVEETPDTEEETSKDTK